PDTNPAFIDRLIVAEDRPFSRGKWTHICMVFDRLNTDLAQGNLYVNGKLQGKRSIQEKFSWNENEAKIMLGLNFVGKLDELAIFNRPLNAAEVGHLYGIPDGLSKLLDRRISK
ncbi:MAG: LamG domain-containing protein, partial [Saprospiraceae bacterium]|nr:LamG domain-containing protein [Saprospiraceae bacterium]